MIRDVILTVLQHDLFLTISQSGWELLLIAYIRDRGTINDSERRTEISIACIDVRQ